MSDALGLAPGIVRVVEYDARWPGLFTAEQQRIREACGALAVQLEHVGGTSIPGMCAKPVLDIAAGRPAGTSALDYVAPLARAGYEHRGERGVPGREFFRRGTPRAYHVHLVVEGGPLWRDYLAFRDYLRSHPGAAQQFADRKRALAARFGQDREAYIEAKSPYVLEILHLASGAA
ncbi:MAG TPA: GrpB family protein [Vicinamibacterales bacterium]|nr:GrpB family protein [Vicinamibacterales bacterium]